MNEAEPSPNELNPYASPESASAASEGMASETPGVKVCQAYPIAGGYFPLLIGCAASLTVLVYGLAVGPVGRTFEVPMFLVSAVIAGGYMMLSAVLLEGTAAQKTLRTILATVFAFSLTIIYFPVCFKEIVLLDSRTPYMNADVAIFIAICMAVVGIQVAVYAYLIALISQRTIIGGSYVNASMLPQPPEASFINQSATNIGSSDDIGSVIDRGVSNPGHHDA